MYLEKPERELLYKLVKREIKLTNPQSYYGRTKLELLFKIKSMLEDK